MKLTMTTKQTTLMLRTTPLTMTLKTTTLTTKLPMLSIVFITPANATFVKIILFKGLKNVTYRLVNVTSRIRDLRFVF